MTGSWPQIPETDEQREARLREVARKVRERFGYQEALPSNSRCPQCGKSMAVEYSESPNELESGTFWQSCWGCGYEQRL